MICNGVNINSGQSLVVDGITLTSDSVYPFTPNPNMIGYTITGTNVTDQSFILTSGVTYNFAQLTVFMLYVQQQAH